MLRFPTPFPQAYSPGPKQHAFPLDVPQGATIVSARLEWTAARPGDTLTRLTIGAQAADNAGPLRADNRNLSNRPVLDPPVNWDVTPWRYELASGPRQASPELRDLVQAIVDRDGFESGNATVLLISGDGDRRAVGVKQDSERGARLIVEYDPSGG